MGLGRFKQTTHKNGELLSQASGTTYWSGSPLAVRKDGAVELASVTDLNLARSSGNATAYIGIARNTSATDALQRDSKVSFLTGTAIVTFQKNSANSNNASINNEGSAGESEDDFPYDENLSWDEADRLFIDANGVWVRTAANADDPHYGVVLKVGTNFLTVLLYNSPSVE